MVYQSLLGKSLILIHSYRNSLRSLLHVRAHIGLHLILTLGFPFTLITSVFWLLYVIHQQIHSILNLRCLLDCVDCLILSFLKYFLSFKVISLLCFFNGIFYSISSSYPKNIHLNISVDFSNHLLIFIENLDCKLRFSFECLRIFFYRLCGYHGINKWHSSINVEFISNLRNFELKNELFRRTR